MQQSLQAGNYTTDTPPKLVPYAHAIYHNRNRTYAPNLGRFMQSDPNATGMVVLESLAYHGEVIETERLVLDLGALHTDGANFYQYLKSNPATASDPLGLYSNEDLFRDATELLGMAGGLMPPGPSDIMRSVLNAMVSDYSANLDFDVDWALDWSLPDDDHSRTDNSWVALAMLRGAYQSFEIDLPFTDDTLNPLDANASGSSKKSVSSGGSGRARTLSAAKRGRDAHRQFTSGKAQMEGWRTEYSEPGIGRFDAINPKKKIIIELKPNTPSGRAKGAKQLMGPDGYVAKMNRRYGGGWTGHLVYYDP